MSFYFTAILLGLGFSSLALGVYISMRIFNIPDITTDGSFTLGGAVTAVLVTQQLPFYLVLPLVFMGGALAGALTGIIHTKLKVNALLAGILVMTALYSINLKIMGRSNIPLVSVESIFDVLNFINDQVTKQFIILITFVISI